MKRILAGLVILGVVAASGSVFAAQAKAKKDAPKVETLIFSGGEIDGVATRPSLQPVFVRRAAKFANRMSTRADFLPELLDSVDSL